MTTTLLVTTYNWPEALNCTLKSIEKQSVMPDEIIIADDGSTQETADLIKLWQQKIKTPIIHSWQEDDGFRAAASRNKAIAKASGEYIIMIDGDLILHPNFILDHIKHSKPNQFSIGTRVLLTENYSKEAIKNDLHTFDIQGDNIISNAKNKINNSFLSNLISYKTKSYKQVRSCNMACFKNDLVKVNGFNEDFIGWGREDTELVVRLLNAEIVRKNIKFNANVLHIYHKENSKKMLPANDLILEKVINQRLKRCDNGLDQYL
ncbi:MAG: glycosyltransferase family 2 protein [Bacteroidetes bacterium]|nr:glycosyltransferase family 2 protein [Bacteroidota bacterium]